MDSFIKYYFVFEVTENPEIVASSVYFYKDGPDDKIHAGPVWDFDSALFNYDKSENLGADPFSDYVKNAATLRTPNRAQASNPWFQDLFRTTQFVARANLLWQQGIGAAAGTLSAMIDEYAAATTESAQQNFAQWNVLGQPTLLIPGEGKTYASTYAGEVDYLRGRVAARVDHLGREYGVVPVLRYRAHVQNVGWDWYASSGQIVGSFGKSLRLEALSLSIADSAGQSGGIEARSHVQDVGWSGWRPTSTVGSEGRGLRLEAVSFRLTGALAEKYDVQYRAHVQNVGWQPWVENGAVAGTEGRSLRIEALQVRLVITSGVNPPPAPIGHTAYSAHVEGIGWMPTVSDGATSGTTGQARRLEALRLSASSTDVAGGIRWRGHVQNVGWESWTTTNQIGSVGRSLRLEAFEISLTDELSQRFSIRYRAHVQGVGWQSWRSDRQTAGTVGQSLRIEAVQIELVPKT